MDATELTKRSPLRALDGLVSSLSKGDLAVVLARHGAGKTPFVVGVALDSLLRRRRVLHITLDSKVDHVRDFYEQIFTEMLKAAGAPVDPLAFLEMERLRRIHAYLGDSFTVEKIVGAVRFMRDHASFTPELMVIDGVDFAGLKLADLSVVRELAAEVGAELWMTVMRHRDEKVDDKSGVPKVIASFTEHIALAIDLKSQPNGVAVSVCWPRPAAAQVDLALDPTTMLLVNR